MLCGNYARNFKYNARIGEILPNNACIMHDQFLARNVLNFDIAGVRSGVVFRSGDKNIKSRIS